MSLKNVTVLMDDDKRKTNFHIKLGTASNGSKVFRFQVFNLMVEDKKIVDHVKLSDGLVIMVDCNNITQNVINRAEYYSSFLTNKPIMIIIEKFGFCKIQYDPCKLFNEITVVDNIKSFVIDHTQRIPDWEYEHPHAWMNEEVKKPVKSKSLIPEIKNKTTSASIPLLLLVSQFETCSIPLSIWDHYCRLRLIFYSLGVYGYDRSIKPNGWLLKNWLEYEKSIGREDKWHYTINKFWVDTIHNIQKIHKYKNFDELYKNQITLWQANLHIRFFSQELLATDAAKTSWIKPDLKNIV